VLTNISYEFCLKEDDSHFNLNVVYSSCQWFFLKKISNANVTKVITAFRFLNCWRIIWAQTYKVPDCWMFLLNIKPTLLLTSLVLFGCGALMTLTEVIETWQHYAISYYMYAVAYSAPSQQNVHKNLNISPDMSLITFFFAATTLTGLHFVTTTLMTIVFRWLGLSQPSQLPLADLIKFVIFSNLSIVGMNVSLMWNSVGFYQVSGIFSS
jgi:hypothetical protein